MACRESFDVSMHKCSVQSPRGGFSAGGPDGMSSAMPAHVLNINMEEPVKRKRRQPRKYVPDGSMALALTPVPTAAPLLPGSGGFSHTTEATNTVTSVSADTIKKARVLPKGFGKKLQMLALGCIIQNHVLFSEWTTCHMCSFGKWCYIKCISSSGINIRWICNL